MDKMEACSNWFCWLWAIIGEEKGDTASLWFYKLPGDSSRWNTKSEGIFILIHLHPVSQKMFPCKSYLNKKCMCGWIWVWNNSGPCLQQSVGTLWSDCNAIHLLQICVLFCQQQTNKNHTIGLGERQNMLTKGCATRMEIQDKYFCKILWFWTQQADLPIVYLVYSQVMKRNTKIYKAHSCS